MSGKKDRIKINLKLSDVMDDSINEIIESTISNEVQEESKKQSELIKILDVWQEEKKSDQTVKILICITVIGLMIYQARFINKLILSIADGTGKIDEWTLRLVIVGVFLEIVAIFKIIVTNLFPPNSSKDFLEFISNFKKSQEN